MFFGFLGAVAHERIRTGAVAVEDIMGRIGPKTDLEEKRMANGKKEKGGGAKVRGRRQARARQGQAGPACPEGLNLPGPSREEYVASVLEQIGEFEEKLGELESGLESAGWDDAGDYLGELEDLRLQLKAARAKSEELEAATDAAWPSVYEEMEGALLEVAGRVEDFASELGRVLPE